jgi:hypothetical protein
MLEFEDFVYLDVQKTASTFIKEFLREFARGAEVDHHRHMPVNSYNPKKAYIISCRDPLSYYLSLYSFGCIGKGGLAIRLNKKNMGHLYDGTADGFTSWLNLILDPQTSQQYLSGFDKHRILDFVGVQTLRFLTLAFPAPLEVFSTLNSKDDVSARLKTDGLMDVVLKTETLTSDLATLTSGRYGGMFKDPAAAERYLAKGKKKNRSAKLDIDPAALPPEILSLIRDREWLFFEALGYQPYL